MATHHGRPGSPRRAALTEPRVALFLHDLGGGGAERGSVNLAAGLAGRGVPVDLVLVQRTGAHLKQVPADVRVVDLGCRRHLTSLVPLMRYLRRDRPAFLLSVLTHTNLYALAARRLARSPTRVVLGVQNTTTEEARLSHGLLGRIIRPAGVRFLYPQADGIVVVSEGAADDLRRELKGIRIPVEVIHNPIVMPALYERAREPLSHPWFSEGGPPVLVAVGRLVQQKNFGLLIRAFALARRAAPGRLLILGDGEERPQLERLIVETGLEDDVRLPGFVGNPYPYMAAARGVILSSHFEGLPTVLVEALALGTPVAATDCPSGPMEILQGGRLGRLVPMGDAAALGKAMLELLQGAPYPTAGPKDLAPYHIDYVVDRYLALMGLTDGARASAS